MTPLEFLYRCCIDPMLESMRERIGELVPPGSSVIDIASGTGALVFRLAGTCRRVTGVDLSPAMIRIAEKTRHKRNINNAGFLLADASSLPEFPDRAFDAATMTMALHQFAPDLRVPVLCEAARLSREIIVADYASPLPRSFYGRLARSIEFLAGGKHHGHFLDYQEQGGLLPLVRRAGLSVLDTEVRGNGVFMLLCVGRDT